MQKVRFHNNKLTNENVDNKQTYQTKYLDPKIVVDINKLLNRVKLEEKIEIKKKITFFSLIILSLGFMGIIIASIK